MNRGKPEALLKPKLLAVSVAACFALNAAPLRANPTGPTVVHGGVGFNGLGTSALTITNQAGGNAIINWNGFSIGINELTRFQQFANLAVLNRVTGSDISSILGSLQSDGRVFLITPTGIVFGAAARIDVAGLVASSLSFSDQDFLANRLRFTEVPGAGAVVNNGVIETAAGGRVYLVAPTVENNGLIQSPQGAIVLAAGKEVELVDAASPFVTVKVAAAEQAVNVGNLVADSGQIGMFGALVRNSGVVEAGGAVAGPGGEIRLVAVKDLNVEAGSVVAASGMSGGKVLLQAESGTNLIGGTVEARGSSGRGGEVSALGVRVGVVGHGVIDASGDNGGGTVLVGGDYQVGMPRFRTRSVRILVLTA
jgi:filamentous hemagglutinin family protein